MTKNKFQKALSRLLREIVNLFQTLTAKLVRWVLRMFMMNSMSTARQGGFVLPTVALLLLMVSLVVAAMLFRTAYRTDQVMGEREEKVIYNAATPAIDRAKAKMEYLFKSDRRRPSGIPDETILTGMMRNDGLNNIPVLNDPSITGNPNNDPYTLPDETRLDIGGSGTGAFGTPDGTKDNAWSYQIPDPTNPTSPNKITVAYSIVWEVPTDPSGVKTSDQLLSDSTATKVEQRAKSLEVRNGPLYPSGSYSNCQQSAAPVAASAKGWSAPPSATTGSVRKNFQINAVVISPTANNAITTLELQQERQADRGNKWGAWFRNDLEVFPGPHVAWNGTLHSEGSIMMGADSGPFEAFLISSPSSCLYTIDSSQITTDYGYILSGRMDENQFDAGSTPSPIHLYQKPQPITNINMASGNDSVADSGSNVPTGPGDLALDPIALFTTAQTPYPLRNNAFAGGKAGDPNWASTQFATNQRMIVNTINTSSATPSVTPFVDDTYRADNRFGPNPSYGQNGTLLQLPNSANTVVTASNPTITPLATACNGGYCKSGMAIPTSVSITPNIHELVTMNPAGTGGDNLSSDPRDLGLDGYWERRAVREGLRVIVGERLELGNTFGWVNDDTNFNGIKDGSETASSSDGIFRIDPLVPFGACQDPARCHEARQRRALRDNLAATQATAVYHYTNSTNGAGTPQAGGYFPIAGLATTVHPGTATTLTNSASFQQFSPQFTVDPTNSAFLSTLFGATFGDAGNEIAFDFLSGNSTNGWEFDVSPLALGAQDEGTYANAINTPTSSLRKALKNLAYFAGDYSFQTQIGGAFPPNQEGAGSAIIHPYPQMAMWGDFSNLRRAIYNLENTVPVQNVVQTYDPSNTNTTANLSIADKSYLHTATLSLGMLAYQLSYLEAFSYTDTTTNQPLITNLDAALQALSDGNPANGEVNTTNGAIYNTSGTNIVPVGTTAITPTPDSYIAALSTGTTGNIQSTPNQQIAKLLHEKEQAKRDRQYGFTASPTTANQYQYPVQYVSGFTYGGVTYNTGDTINLGCDFSNSSTGNNYFGINGINGITDAPTEKKFIRLATSLCYAQPKFPALHYIFPTTTSSLAEDRLDPNSNYIKSTANPTGNIYQVVGTSYPNSVSEIAIRPRNVSEWKLPYVNYGAGAAPDGTLCPGGTTSGPNCSGASLVKYTQTGQPATYIRTAFKDAALFDGREMSNVRALDMDLNLLRGAVGGETNATINGDYWLALGNSSSLNPMDGGIVYAFREDAKREDSIARPAASGWASCNTVTTINTAGCYTIARPPQNPQDPPLNADNNISPKPVDFYPDPDRRPYGFRFKNGDNLQRPNSTFGLSFVSDNTLYIQGNLNCHNTCATPIEEFQETLYQIDSANNQSGFLSAFYSRSTLNANFAKSNNDSWRTTELLADGITLLSTNFCDGSVEDGIVKTHWGQVNTTDRQNIYGCNGNSIDTSYFNQNRPNTDNSINSGDWVRENPNGDTTSPVKISNNGNPLYSNASTGNKPIDVTTNYDQFIDGKNLMTAATSSVNAMVVSGIIPSQPLQTYGGMHNFPRFIEDWSSIPSAIAGSFIQLNFSSSATGLYDQDAWESGAPPQSNAVHSSNSSGSVSAFYNPPNRRWGYDVALQYVPAGPAANRLVSVGNARSEYYTELPVSDPYIASLRCAISPYTGIKMDPNASVSDCNS